MSELLTLAEVAARFPRPDGKPLSHSSVWRWCLRGCRGVRLEHKRFGSRIYVAPEALERFGAAVAEAAKSAPPIPRKRTAP